MTDFAIVAHYLDLKAAQLDLLQLATIGLVDEVKHLETDVAVDLALYASDISPFVTGSLSASHIVTDMGDSSLVHISETAVNPFSLEDPHEYGPKVHAMGGHRAFYDRTVDEAADQIIDHHRDVFYGRVEAIF